MGGRGGEDVMKLNLLFAVHRMLFANCLNRLTLTCNHSITLHLSLSLSRSSSLPLTLSRTHTYTYTHNTHALPLLGTDHAPQNIVERLIIVGLLAPPTAMSVTSEDGKVLDTPRLLTFAYDASTKTAIVRKPAVRVAYDFAIKVESA